MAALKTSPDLQSTARHWYLAVDSVDNGTSFESITVDCASSRCAVGIPVCSFGQVYKSTHRLLCGGSRTSQISHKPLHFAREAHQSKPLTRHDAQLAGLQKLTIAIAMITIMPIENLCHATW